MLESVIEYKEGNTPNEKCSCFFCEKDATVLFGITQKDAKVMAKDGSNCFIHNSVGLCNIHAEAFNSLLSGEHDVNNLITVMRTAKTGKINLRRL